MILADYLEALCVVEYSSSPIMSATFSVFDLHERKKKYLQSLFATGWKSHSVIPPISPETQRNMLLHSQPLKSWDSVVDVDLGVCCRQPSY